MNKPLSPLTHDSKTKLERRIPTSMIIDTYKKLYGQDVSSYFKNLETVDVYLCQETGYRFYYPFSTSGDDHLYQELSKFPWYYMDWKWEHEVAYKHIKKGDQVLEIGCGPGAFLGRIKKKGAQGVGLDFNKIALSQAKAKGLEVYNQDIEKFSQNHLGKFDVVCLFQVLEHITSVDSFLKRCLKVLKKGGILIFGVPNNDSFIKYDHQAVLDMPPHHMGLWNKKSLKSLAKLYNLDLVKNYFEPLETYHRSYFIECMRKKFQSQYGYLGLILFFLTSPIYILKALFSPQSIIGLTIVTIYKKR